MIYLNGQSINIHWFNIDFVVLVHRKHHKMSRIYWCAMEFNLFTRITFVMVQHTQNSIYYYIIITMSVGLIKFQEEFSEGFPFFNKFYSSYIIIIIYANITYIMIIHICTIHHKLTVHFLMILFLLLFVTHWQSIILQDWWFN